MRSFLSTSAVSPWKRLDEELREHRVEPLRNRIGRRDHDAPVSAQSLDEREARRRGVDDDHLAREAGEEFAPLRRLEIRADEIELRVHAVVRAVPDEHDEQQIVARHRTPYARQVLPHVRRGRRGRRVVCVGEHFDPIAADLHPIDEDARQIPYPSRVLFGVLRSAARSRHHERVPVASRRGRRKRGRDDRQEQRRPDAR